VQQGTFADIKISDANEFELIGTPAASAESS
jgi:hypothetical protein